MAAWWNDAVISWSTLSNISLTLRKIEKECAANGIELTQPKNFEEYDKCMTEIEQIKKKVSLVLHGVCSNFHWGNWETCELTKTSHGRTIGQNGWVWRCIWLTTLKSPHSQLRRFCVKRSLVKWWKCWNLRWAQRSTFRESNKYHILCWSIG